MSHLLSTRGFIDVGLVGENHDQINMVMGNGLLLDEGVVPFCASLLTSPHWLDPQLAIVID